jgi:hypothetical protein
MARTRPHHPGDDDLGSLFGNSPVDRAMERVPPAPVPSGVRALADQLPRHPLLGRVATGGDQIAVFDSFDVSASKYVVSK